MSFESFLKDVSDGSFLILIVLRSRVSALICSSSQFVLATRDLQVVLMILILAVAICTKCK